MILSDRDIRRRLEVGDIVIDPLDDPELQIQPASVDLRLGQEFLTFNSSNIPCIRPDRGDDIDGYVDRTTIPGSSADGQQSLREFERDVDGDIEEAQREFILHPGDFVLGTTKERVAIPPDLIAHVEGRSSLGRLAVVVHASLPANEAVFLWTPEDGFGFHEIGTVVEERRRAHAVGFNPATLRVGTFPITDYLRRPAKRIYRVALESGRAVSVTRDHNLFTIDDHGGVTRIASEDAEGALVMVPGRLPSGAMASLDLVSLLSDDEEVLAYAADGSGSTPLTGLTSAIAPADTAVTVNGTDARLPRSFSLTPEFGWALGCYVARGAVQGDRIRLPHRSVAVLDRFEAWIEPFADRIDRKQLADEFEALSIRAPVMAKLFGALSGPGKDRHVPRTSWNWDDDVLAACFEGLRDGLEIDGRWHVDAVPEGVADRLLYFAARLGKWGTARGGDDRWHVEIGDEPPERRSQLPVPGSLLRSLRREAGLGTAQVANELEVSPGDIRRLERGESAAIERSRLVRLAERYGEKGASTRRLEQLIAGDIRFERVERVEATDRIEPTYDLEVQPHGRTIENFLGGRGGIFLSNTAGLCDPGYEGQITLELSNLGTAPVALTPEMRIAQLTFTELTSPAERPYGTERGSKYQGQEGPQASRLQSDPEFDNGG